MIVMCLTLYQNNNKAIATLISSSPCFISTLLEINLFFYFLFLFFKQQLFLLDLFFHVWYECLQFENKGGHNSFFTEALHIFIHDAEFKYCCSWAMVAFLHYSLTPEWLITLDLDNITSEIHVPIILEALRRLPLSLRWAEQYNHQHTFMLQNIGIITHNRRNGFPKLA